MTTWDPHANELFLKALELRSPGERQEYLNGVCGADAALRAEVEALLQAGDRAGSFLESPARDRAATVEEVPITEGPGTVIGPYQLLEQIGEGGFGAVFLAQQHEPMRRQVALKVLKPGMDSKQVVARFEAERQALALMDHPNIAQVHDGGATPSGRPYFVMELVKGVPLTNFCDQNHLTPRQRLGLFADVCRAVQHAHQKGVIHRDLKPSNVLVTLQDTMPVVKVIDFGIAKALGQELTDKTFFTSVAQMVGTPLYMSPEQAGMSDLDVDTRSDVYSLGVLLYELLTGTTPFDKERFQNAGYDEIRRIIREEEPARPSTRLSTLGPAAAMVSANRGSDPRALSRLFRGELDWVVMRALEKDRTRRYETASAFAADVLHYLNNEPVEACPPSAGYRLRKLVGRHQRILATAGAFALLLLVGVVVSTWQAVRATAAEQRAVAERKQAQAEAAKFKAVVDFLREDVFLAKRDGLFPVQYRDRALTVRELLHQAEKGIPGRFEGQPLAEAVVRQTLSMSYLTIGDVKAAQPHSAWAHETHQRLLGPEHPQTLASALEHALTCFLNGKYAQAQGLLDRLLTSERVTSGADDRLAFQARELSAQLHQAQRRSLEEKAARRESVAGLRRLPGVTTANLAGALCGLGECLIRRREFAEAEPVLRESVGLWEQFDPACFDVLRTKHQLGLALAGQQKYREAEKLLLDAYTGVRDHWRQKAPNLSRHFLPLFLESLIEHYEITGRPDQAAAWRKERQNQPSKE
jgi:serine/threonine protein kinase